MGVEELIRWGGGTPNQLAPCVGGWVLEAAPPGRGGEKVEETEELLVVPLHHTNMPTVCSGASP